MFMEQQHLEQKHLEQQHLEHQHRTNPYTKPNTKYPLESLAWNSIRIGRSELLELSFKISVFWAEILPKSEE